MANRVLRIAEGEQPRGFDGIVIEDGVQGKGIVRVDPKRHLLRLGPRAVEILVQTRKARDKRVQLGRVLFQRPVIHPALRVDMRFQQRGVGVI